MIGARAPEAILGKKGVSSDPVMFGDRFQYGLTSEVGQSHWSRIAGPALLTLLALAKPSVFRQSLSLGGVDHADRGRRPWPNRERHTRLGVAGSAGLVL